MSDPFENILNVIKSFEGKTPPQVLAGISNLTGTLSKQLELAETIRPVAQKALASKSSFTNTDGTKSEIALLMSKDVTAEGWQQIAALAVVAADSMKGQPG